MRSFDRATIDRFLNELGAQLDGLRPTVPPPSGDPAAQPIVWIVGTPRSGTTLLAEVMAASTDIGYVDNLAARFPGCPEAGMLLSASMRPAAGAAGARAAGAAPGAATSDTADTAGTAGTAGTAPNTFPAFDIGRTPGPHGTHEFGFFWSRWLGLAGDAGHRLDDARRAAVDIAGLGDQLRRMIAVADRPFMVRNVICGLNAALVATAHPPSLFVELQRNPTDTAASILTCRRTRGGGAEAWWSLRPSTWRADRTPAADRLAAAAECAAQVSDIRQDLRDERRRVAELDGPARWRVVDYAALCTDPAATVAAIVADVAALGGRLQHAPAAHTPDAPRAAPPLPADEQAAIAGELARRPASPTR